MWAKGATWASSPGRASARACAAGSAKAPGLGRRVSVIDVDHAGDGLLLEPLAGVARRDAGGLGQLARGQRPEFVQRAVQTELRAEVDGAQLQRAERGAEQALGEGVGAIGGGGHGRQGARRALRPHYGGPTN
jgi:hypothetical protein